MSDPTLGEIWDRLTPDQQKKAFFLFWGIVKFYGDGMTWFATDIIADPPAGAITTDYRHEEELDRRAPGGRARLALSWVVSMFRRALTPAATAGSGG